MNTLRKAAQQALEALEFYYELHKEEADEKAINALRAALAEPPVDDPHRDHWVAIAEAAQKIAASKECGPMEAKALCAALDRLTEAMLAEQRLTDMEQKMERSIESLKTALAEPEGGGNLSPPLQEPTVAEIATTQQQLDNKPPSDYRRGYWDGFNIGKREGRIEAEDALAEPVFEVGFGWLDDATKYPKGTKLYTHPAEPVQEPQCNPHPKAPHGFLRNASHNEDRYVCECEGWEPYEAGYQAGMEAALKGQA